MKAVAEDLFAGLNQESEQEKQEFKVTPSPQLEKLLTGFEWLLSYPDPGFMELGDPIDEYYAQANTRFRYFDRTSAQLIGEFSILSAAYEAGSIHFGTKFGAYVSALINRCKDKKITIHTRHFEKVPTGIGYQMKKRHLTINGPVESIGKEMESGTITANEFVATAGYKMKGGTIIIDSDAGKVGPYMEGGKIIVYGDVDMAGQWMEGGQIQVSGDASCAGGYADEPILGGRVLVGGKIGFVNGARGPDGIPDKRNQEGNMLVTANFWKENTLVTKRSWRGKPVQQETQEHKWWWQKWF